MKSLVKNSVFNTVYTVLNLLFPLIIATYVARVLLPDGVGKVAYAQTIVSYFVMLAMLGIPNYGVREISKVRNDKEKKNILFTELLVFNAISTIASLIFFVILIVSFDFFYNQWLLFLACGSLILFNIINIDWLYQGEEEYEYIVLRSLFVKILSIVLIFVFVNVPSDLIVYASISTFAVAGNYVLNIYHAKKYVKIRFENINIKRHLKPIIVMAVGVLLSSIYGKIDITMLGYGAADKNIGFYTYANKIIEICITVCTSLTAVFMPRLSYYYKFDKVKFKNLVKTGTDIISMISFPMCAGIYILAPEIIFILFGQEFVQAAYSVRVLSILILIKSYGNLLCFQLVMCTGNEKERIPATAIGSLANVLLNWWFIPFWLEIGAAIATVVSEFLVNAYQFVQMKRKLELKFTISPIMQALITTSAMGLVIIAILKINYNIYVDTIIATAGGIITYIVTNILIGNDLMIKMLNKIIKH